MPSSADSRNTSTGKCLVVSHSSAYGATRLAAKAAAVSVMTRSSSFRVNTALIHCGDDEFGTFFDAGRPPGRDGLDLGVELDRRRAVLVEVAEAGALPAAEGVVGHRDRDRHVDSDHAHLHPGDEIAGGVAVAGEDRHAVAVLVLRGQAQRLLVVVGPDYAQHRPEDLVGVDRHVGGDVVEEG